MFRFKGIASKSDQTFGFIARLFGIDVTLLLIWSRSDWRLIELKIPCNCGFFLQLGWLVASIGRLDAREVYGDD